MKNPFEKYRAFSAYLVAIPEREAIEHLWECFKEGPEDNMAFEIAAFYGLTMQQPKKILERLREDSKKYDLSGFEFVEKT